MQRDAEQQAVHANRRLSAESAVVHHDVNVSRAEVQSAREEVVGVMQFADQRYEEAKQQLTQELRAQAMRELEQHASELRAEMAERDRVRDQQAEQVVQRERI